MKTMKRILALLMVATMALSLAACGKKAERADVPIEFDENGNYIVPSVVLELTGWNTQGTNYIMGPDYGYKDVTSDWLESKTNVVYKNIYGNDNGSWDAKLDMLVTGGDLPDLVFCGAFQGPAHFNKLDQYDVLYHLDPEMIQKVAPNLWARTPAECWEAFTVTKDGETYITGIPYAIDIRYDEPFTGKMTMNGEEFVAPDFVPYTEDEIKYIRETQKKYETDVTFLSTQCLYVRDDILQDFFPNAASYDEMVERLNEKKAPLSDEMMEGININSTEQLVKFMYDIQKAGYKTDDGKTVYAFGYSGADNWLALSQFGSELMGYKNHNYSGTINWEEEKYELFLLSDIVKEAARIQNQMINDGVIEKESLAQSTGAYEEKVLAGRYAIAAINSFDIVGNVNDQLEASGATYKYRPLIMNIPNDERYPAFYEPTMWMSSLAITTNMKECHVYQLLNWIDQQYTTEWEEIAAWGTEGDELFVDTYEEVTDEEGNTTQVLVGRKYKDERFNKYFIEEDGNALGDGETLGLGDTSGSEFPVYPLKVTKWNPVILNKCVIYGESGDGGFRFTPDSKHVQNVKEFPLTQIWSSIYADIPEVVEYWSKRETWENAVLSALAAAPGEFEAKWAELERTMNGIINVEEFERKCTEAVIDDIKALKEKEAAATEA